MHQIVIYTIHFSPFVATYLHQTFLHQAFNYLTSPHFAQFYFAIKLQNFTTLFNALKQVHHWIYSWILDVYLTNFWKRHTSFLVTQHSFDLANKLAIILINAFTFWRTHLLINWWTLCDICLFSLTSVSIHLFSTNVKY